MTKHDAHVEAYDHWIESEIEYAESLQNEREYYDDVIQYHEESLNE